MSQALLCNLKLADDIMLILRNNGVETSGGHGGVIKLKTREALEYRNTNTPFLVLISLFVLDHS